MATSSSGRLTLSFILRCYPGITSDRKATERPEERWRALRGTPEVSPCVIWTHSSAAIRAGGRHASFRQGPHLQDRPSESGNRQRDCSDPQTAVVVNHQDRPGWRSSTGHCVYIAAPTSPPWAGPPETRAIPHPPRLEDSPNSGTRWCSWLPTPGFAPAASPSNHRAPRALVNLTCKVPLHWDRTSSLTNTPTSRKNKASTTKE